MTLTERLSRRALQTRTDEISPAAYEAAKKLLLDALGCAIAARKAPGVGEVLEQMRDWGGKPEATVIASGDKLPAPNAIFANGTLIHALDYDDIHMPGTLHITSIIVPIVLAAAERSRAPGREVLAALIMGIEVAGRLGKAERMRRRGMGFLSSSIVGGFGGVAAAARLLGLTESQCVNAMGINYAQASGNRQALLDATLTKRMQPAFAARSAMWAVDLAARGVTGPERALEGAAGFFNVYLNGDACPAEELDAESEWMEVERVSLKRFPSCGGCHSVQIAAERLLEEGRFKPEAFERVELFGCGPGGLVGHPFELGEHPQVSVHFSAAWGVAHTLLRGPATLPDYTDERIRADLDVVALAKAITFVKAPPGLPPGFEAPPDYPEHASKPHGVIVHTRDGGRLMQTQSPAETFRPGGHGLDAAVSKFHQCAAFSGTCDREQAKAIVQAASQLDSMPDLDRLLGSINGRAT